MSMTHDKVDAYHSELLESDDVEFRPTHCITFTHITGLRMKMWVVMLQANGEAPDIDEWREELSANWRWSPGVGWTHRNKRTPWQWAGRVEAREV